MKTRIIFLKASLIISFVLTFFMGGSRVYAQAQYFVTTWETTSINEKITIPTTGGGYDYLVDWGEGGALQRFTGNAVHTYATPGKHIIRISGTFPRIYFNNAGDKNKILSVDQWGYIEWANMNGAFNGCSNLKILAKDAPRLGNVRDMQQMFGGAKSFNQNINHWNVSRVRFMHSVFRGATSFNQPLNNWDVSSVTSMKDMFFGATSFNQSLGAWDLSSVTDMGKMLENSAMSSTNYDATLTGWSNNPNTPDDITLGAQGRKYCNSRGARANLIAKGWTINGDGTGCSPEDYFITTWKTTTPNEQITIPTLFGGYDYDVDWGDGTKSLSQTDRASHVYKNPGNHVVRINGLFPKIYFADGKANGGDKHKILSVDQWGTIPWRSMIEAFEGCSNLQVKATDAPQLVGDIVVGKVYLSMQEMFKGATSFNSDIGHWDISRVNDMTSMLDGSGLSVENYDATLTGWYNNPNTRNGITLGAAGLKYCNAIGARSYLTGRKGWTITDTGWGCSPENDFVITVKTDNPGRSGDTQFTIPIYGRAGDYLYDVDWNNDGVFDQFGITRYVTHDFGAPGTYTIRIKGTFPQIYLPNSGDEDKLISVQQWGTNAWVSMYRAFDGCSNLRELPTDSPNLNHLTDLSLMFRDATSLNTPLNTWDVSHITEMQSMFSGATSFDQSLGDWDLSGAPAMLHMLDSSGLSVANYDATLSGWNNNPNTPDGITLGAEGLKYCNARIARDYLARDLTERNGKGWTITDAGPGCSPENDFVITVKTDNPGRSGDTQFTIPIWPAGEYLYDVDWNNDSIFDQFGITSFVTHNFGAPGTYTIRIRGAFPQIYLPNSGDEDKLISVKQWGTTAWLNMYSAFSGCSNLNSLPAEAPNLSRVTDMAWMFKDATSFNQYISHWDVSGVIGMLGVFSGATSFNQYLGDWDLSGAPYMGNMLDNTALSVANYDATLSGWYNNPNTPNLLTLGAEGLNYCRSKNDRISDRIRLINSIKVGGKAWTITDAGLNCTLDDISLSSDSIAENSGADAVVGILGPSPIDPTKTYTYTLVDGIGDTDNDLFNINGAELRATNDLDYETQKSYSVRINVNNGRSVFEKAFTITVTDMDDAPTDISLSSDSIAENSGANAVVGILGPSPIFPANTYTYTLVDGSGDTDNDSFNINGTELRATNDLDYETQKSYSVRINVNDRRSDFEKVFTIAVTDVNDAPTDISLSSNTIAENAGADAVVGSLSAEDVDTGADSHTFTLVNGLGDTGNAAFNISGTDLRATNDLDYETQKSYSVRINVNDGTGNFEKAFTITVTDVSEATEGEGDEKRNPSLRSRPKAYPTLVKDVLKIKPPEGEKVKNIFITDLKGRKLADVEGDIRNVDLSAYPAGIYLLKIETNSQTIVSKIIKR